MAREIILDTETTGLDPYSGHRIIEIGAVEMINKVVTSNRFHYYVNPERDVPIESFRIHGISAESLKDKPLFKDIGIELVEFIGNSRVIIHNAQFDIRFINFELSKAKLPTIDFSNAVDTLILAKKMFPGLRVNLDALCKRFKIDNSHRSSHGALIDALLLAEVYVELRGGRQSKFDLKTATDLNTQITQASSINYGKTPVLKPTEAEVIKHQQFLAKFLS